MAFFFESRVDQLLPRIKRIYLYERTIDLNSVEYTCIYIGRICWSLSNVGAKRDPKLVLQINQPLAGLKQ